MIYLQTDRLKVSIPEPGEAPNNTFRFDRAGYISDVVLDGNLHYCASEPRNLSNPCSGGRGLCNEFCFDVSSKVANGQYYPKLGVGLIEKENNENYTFYGKYNNVKFFDVDYIIHNNTVSFTTKAIPCLGYALKCEKEISVENNEITMRTTAYNTGDKNIHIREYCHNFLSIDGMAIGPVYTLDFPDLHDLGHGQLNNWDDRPGIYYANGKEITISSYSDTDSYMPINPSLVKDATPFCWQLSNKAAGAYVRVTEDFKPGEIYIWSIDHIVSPEIYHCFSIDPNNSHTWVRRWTFDLL